MKLVNLLEFEPRDLIVCLSSPNERSNQDPKLFCSQRSDTANTKSLPSAR